MSTKARGWFAFLSLFALTGACGAPNPQKPPSKPPPAPVPEPEAPQPVPDYLPSAQAMTRASELLPQTPAGDGGVAEDAPKDEKLSQEYDLHASDHKALGIKKADWIADRKKEGTDEEFEYMSPEWAESLLN